MVSYRQDRQVKNDYSFSCLLTCKLRGRHVLSIEPQLRYPVPGVFGERGGKMTKKGHAYHAYFEEGKKIYLGRQENLSTPVRKQSVQYGPLRDDSACRSLLASLHHIRHVAVS